MSQINLEVLQIIEMFDKENRSTKHSGFCRHLDVSDPYIRIVQTLLDMGLPKKSYREMPMNLEQVVSRVVIGSFLAGRLVELRPSLN